MNQSKATQFKLKELLLTFVFALIAAAVFHHHKNEIKQAFYNWTGLSLQNSAGLSSIVLNQPNTNIQSVQTNSVTMDSLTIDFKGKLLSGENFRLSDYIGKKMILLSFFATWCGPCRLEVPHLNKLVADYPNELFILGIASGENQNIVKTFSENVKMSYPVLLDGDTLVKIFNIQGFPGSVIIGLDGKVQFSGLAEVDPRSTIEKLLKTNQQILKSHQNISLAQFQETQEKMGRTLLEITPYSAEPVAGFNIKEKSEIHDIRVVSETPNIMNVEIDYTYSGEVGDQRIYIDCDPHLSDGAAPFAMRPATVSVGRHVASTQLSSYSGTPQGAESTTVKCFMNSRLTNKNLTEKSVEYKKVWSR